ncbi:hypothetical protein PsorP6_004939 [Peronosclerospora sorghi]|uniref:Uncharacterized protein n=1 Tax=Peronosclerospora sorghi TaxID=230839 RepID=A0ACC0W5G0_9STRA|nr:hypothetical protein PsorP6_004939 [Peronosclerospora sorghi]
MFVIGNERLNPASERTAQRRLQPAQGPAITQPHSLSTSVAVKRLIPFLSSQTHKTTSMLHPTNAFRDLDSIKQKVAGTVLAEKQGSKC